MSLSKRIAALEEVLSPSAEVWLIDLLTELCSARAENREPAPRRPTTKEQADLITKLPVWGLNTKVWDNGEHEW